MGNLEEPLNCWELTDGFLQHLLSAQSRSLRAGRVCTFPMTEPTSHEWVQYISPRVPLEVFKIMVKGLYNSVISCFLWRQDSDMNWFESNGNHLWSLNSINERKRTGCRTMKIVGPCWPQIQWFAIIFLFQDAQIANSETFNSMDPTSVKLCDEDRFAAVENTSLCTGATLASDILCFYVGLVTLRQGCLLHHICYYLLEAWKPISG